MVRYSAEVRPAWRARVLDVLAVLGQGLEARHLLHERQDVPSPPYHIAQQVCANSSGWLHSLLHEVSRRRQPNCVIFIQTNICIFFRIYKLLKILLLALWSNHFSRISSKRKELFPTLGPMEDTLLSPCQGKALFFVHPKWKRSPIAKGKLWVTLFKTN